MKIIKPIEFYVYEDGETFGMSFKELARFIGINEATVRETLTKLKSGKKLSKTLTLNHLNVFTRGANNEPISLGVCRAIIFYYAFESENVSLTVQQKAIKAYSSFDKILQSLMCKND